MLVVLLMAAFAIDLATMYQRHHQAQVAADAAALGAANCLINGKSANQCTSVTDTADAAAVATAIARANGMVLTSTTQVSINTASHSVTVQAGETPPVDFAGLVGLNPSVTARSVASFSLPDLPYAIFAGNTSCTAGSGIQILSNGGGSANLNGLFSDGVINNNDNSGSANYSGGAYGTGAIPQCGSGSAGGTNSWQTKNTTIITQAEKAYPVRYSEPVVAGSTYTSAEPTSAPAVTPGTCTFASSYFSTDGAGIHAIYWPGIYCVTDSSGNLATTYGGSSCGGTAIDDTTSSIYVGQLASGSAPSGAFEFAGPCVVANQSLSGSLTPVSSSAPIIYGTAQAAAPCLMPTTNLVNPSAAVSSPDNIYLAGNNLSLNASIYAPCGTVELSGNTSYAAFIEAANITIDKNGFSSWTGTGPIGAAATDGLSG
jgi:hypothetical protein